MFRRRRLQQDQAPEEHLSEQAKRLRKDATGMPHGFARERLARLARQAEVGAQISAWLRSPKQPRPK